MIGGVERVVQDIAVAGAVDFDVTVLVVNDRRENVVEQQNGYRVRKLARQGKLLSAPLAFDYIPEFRRLAATADIINIHSPYPPVELAASVTRAAAPLVDTYHFDIVRQRMVAPFYRPLLNATLSRCRRIVVSNPNLAATSFVLQQFRDRVECIPFGVNPDEYILSPEEEARAAELRHRFRRPVVLFAGRLVYYKGVEYLVRAAAECDIELVIVGQGPLLVPLSKLARQLSIADRVHFLPHLERRELICHFHACDLFVLPSSARSEAFGLVMLDAMACAKPVVSTELGTGTSWVNQDGKTGSVVPPCDHRALAAAIGRFATDPALRLRAGQAAVERLRTVFTKQSFAASYRALFRSLIGQPS